MPIKFVGVEAARVFVLLALASLGARADSDALGPQAILPRPITLAPAAGEITIRADVSNYSPSTSNSSPGTGGSESGIAAVFGADVGVTPWLQLGVGGAAASMPPSDSAVSRIALGDLYGTADFALARGMALRADAGYENRNGIHGALIGFGLPVKLPVGRGFAFVSGDTSAIRFAHFLAVGNNGNNAYFGSEEVGTSADIFTATLAGNSGSELGLHLPLGILYQPAPLFACRLRTGYAAEIDLPPNGGTAVVTHYLPLGADLIFSLNAQFDLGASFEAAGYLHSSAETHAGTFTDTIFGELWLRFRASGWF